MQTKGETLGNIFKNLGMKQITLLILLVAYTNCLGQFKNFDREMFNEIELLKGVKPDNYKENWILKTSYDSVIFKKGESIKYPKDSKDRYFMTTLLANQTKWIGVSVYIATYSSGQFEEYRSDEELIIFIGKINDIYEAILLAYRKGYSTDANRADLNKYKVEDGKFIIKLCKIYGCPNKKQEVELVIATDGKIIEKKKAFYNITNDCDTFAP